MFNVNRGLITFIFGVGLVFSQFYVFSSGLPQPSHILMIIPFFIFLMNGKIFKFGIDNRTSKVLIIFLFYSTFVNLFYALTLQSEAFIFPILHTFYGLMVFYTVGALLLNQNNLNSIRKYLIIALLLLATLAIFGIGDFKFYPRYNAFFNDPNQMAFWTLCVGAMLLAQRSLSDVVKGIIFILVFLIITKSASRSGLVGFMLLFFGFSFNYLQAMLKELSIKRLFAILLGIGSCIWLGYYFVINNFDSIEYVFSRIDRIDLGEQAEMRGYSRLLEFPEYLIFGAGQALDHRFGKSLYEIHSTWAALLFYYGIPGVLLILSSIYFIFKNLDLSQKILFFSPLFYSFSTLGYRTPIFWILLAVFYTIGVAQFRSSEYSLSTHGKY